MVTTIPWSANMAADAANRPRPRYMHGIWSWKTHGNDLGHGVYCSCTHALLSGWRRRAGGRLMRASHA